MPGYYFQLVVQLSLCMRQLRASPRWRACRLRLRPFPSCFETSKTISFFKRLQTNPLTDNYFAVFAIALLHNTDFLENFKDWGFCFVLNLQGCFGDFNLSEGQDIKVNFFIFEHYFISPASLIVSVWNLDLLLLFFSSLLHPFLSFHLLLSFFWLALLVLFELFTVGTVLSPTPRCFFSIIF